MIKSILRNLALCAIVGTGLNSKAQTVTVNPGATWLGYMNVFNLPVSGNYPSSAPGAYQFGSGWGTADLAATFSGPTLTLSANTIGDPAAYWYTPSGGPGATGNKIMAASMYVQPADGTYTGTTLSFTGNVLASSLLGSTDANGHGWTAIAFIKDFAPDYSTFNISSTPIVNGIFNINLATVNNAARHIQYGFEVVGPNVWVTDAAAMGNIQITAVPEPSILTLAGLGATLLVLRRRNS